MPTSLKTSTSAFNCLTLAPTDPRLLADCAADLAERLSTLIQDQDALTDLVVAQSVPHFIAWAGVHQENHGGNLRHLMRVMCTHEFSVEEVDRVPDMSLTPTVRGVVVVAALLRPLFEAINRQKAELRSLLAPLSTAGRGRSRGQGPVGQSGLVTRLLAAAGRPRADLEAIYRQFALLDPHYDRVAYVPSVRPRYYKRSLAQVEAALHKSRSPAAEQALFELGPMRADGVSHLYLVRRPQAKLFANLRLLPPYRPLTASGKPRFYRTISANTPLFIFSPTPAHYPVAVKPFDQEPDVPSDLDVMLPQWLDPRPVFTGLPFYRVM